MRRLAPALVLLWAACGGNVVLDHGAGGSSSGAGGAGGAGSTGTVIGSGPCSSDAQCPAQTKCDVTIKKCVGAVDLCSTDAECTFGDTCDPSTNTCVPSANPACMSDSDCTGAQSCDFTCGSGRCVAESSGCITDGDCQGGDICNPTTGACVPQCPGNCTPTNDPCAQDADCCTAACASGVCE